MKKTRLVERLRYAFDNSLSRGPIALVAWLGLASAGLVLLATFIVWITRQGPPREPFANILWDILYQALTPNPVDPNLGPTLFLLTMLVVTVGSLFLVSILIGVMTASIDHRVQALRRGRSRVLEHDHIVILGWSEQIFVILTELAAAQAGQRRSCIVILGEQDKLEMEEAVREKAGRLGRTRVVCRSGSPMSPTDLSIVSLNTARAIIVLGPEDDDPDSSVIKALLAITNHPNRRPEPYHIVAEIRSPHNVEAARLVGGDEVELVLAGDVIARMIAQTSRQAGLSIVYTELLDFSGGEIYFAREPALAGRAFGEALFAYEDSTLIGVCPAGGPPKLNPPMDARLQAGDQLLLIADDETAVRLSAHAPAALDLDAIAPATPILREPERTLVLGWNWLGASVLQHLDAYVPPGSATTVVASFPGPLPAAADIGPRLANQSVEFRSGDTTSRPLLNALGVENYTHVIVLAYSDSLPLQKADAQTLVTLLHLREIAERHGHPFTIVSEMLDVRNRALAEVTHVDDFIVSERVISLTLAQIAENKALKAVLDDLFDPHSSDLFLKPAAHYVAPGRPVSFYTVVEAARRRGEVAVGYRLCAQAADAGRAYGIVLNPKKSVPVTFADGDRVIVLAQV